MNSLSIHRRKDFKIHIYLKYCIFKDKTSLTANLSELTASKLKFNLFIVSLIDTCTAQHYAEHAM